MPLPPTPPRHRPRARAHLASPPALAPVSFDFSRARPPPNLPTPPLPRLVQTVGRSGRQPRAQRRSVPPAATPTRGGGGRPGFPPCKLLKAAAGDEATPPTATPLYCGLDSTPVTSCGGRGGADKRGERHRVAVDTGVVEGKRGGGGAAQRLATPPSSALCPLPPPCTFPTPQTASFYGQRCPLSAGAENHGVPSW